VQVLMSEITSDRARTAVSVLEAHGHEIVTCGDGTPRALPCAALRGESCVLSAHSVDVALHVEGPQPPGLGDEGLLCAIRSFVPVVVATTEPGIPSEPFGPWAAAICDLHDLDEALVAAAAAPLEAHGAAATRAANAVLASAGMAPAWRAVVRRERRRLRVELISDEPIDADLCARSAVRAEGAIREIDGVTPTIDVEIAAPHQ